MKVATLAASAVVASGIDLTWSDCGDASTQAKITDLQPTTLNTGSNQLKGSGILNKDEDGATFTFTAKAGPVPVLKGSGNLCEDTTINLPLGAGSVVFHAIGCPLKAGNVELDLDVNILSGAVSNDLVNIAVAATSTSGDKLLCMNLGIASSFEDWKAQFGKVYNGEEEAHAKANWEANNKIINDHNAQGTFQLGHNQFSDMNTEEFAAAMLTLKQPTEKLGGAAKLGVHEWDGSPLADSIDWVAKGAVNPIKDQGQCGSCWAFSTIGSLEGAWQLASGQLAPMSEQQLVDCDHNGDQGCQGGLMDNAFEWFQTTKAATCSESSYPYKGRAGTCQESSCSTVIPSGGVTGYTDVASSEQALMSALNQQPVSIAVQANLPTFQMYRSGIMSGICGANLDHGILAVGYGEENGQKYWKVRNSWGTSWGMAGYGLLLRGKGGSGQCGILKQPSYPVVSASSVTV